MGQGEPAEKRQDSESLHEILIESAFMEPGDTLLTYLRRLGYQVSAPCGGHGSCGKCLVKLLNMDSPSQSPREQVLLGLLHAEKEWRLACNVHAEPGMKVLLPENPLLPGQQEAQIIESMPLNAGREASLFAACFKKKDELDKLLPWHGSMGPWLGAAMDIGTTTIVVYLLDLLSGQTLGTKSFLNPQSVYGADVLTRIQYANQREDHGKVLQTMLIQRINQGLAELMEEAKMPVRHICRLTAAGNTTMLHFLLGESTAGMGGSPFTPAFLAMQRRNAMELGFLAHPKAELLTLPCIAAFAGGDLLAAMAASSMLDSQSLELLVDIGTNGEIALGCAGHFAACSTAAGPAFEGGRIVWGMGGVAGAIDHVTLSDDAAWSSLGQQSPRGLCGSGLVDLIGELLRCSLLDSSGRLLSPEEAVQAAAASGAPVPGQKLLERLREDETQRFFMIDEASGIKVYQKDIRELQLAKGAIHAGIQCLMTDLKVSPEQIETVWLTGGFGNYLNIDQAFRIGLLPKGLQEKTRAIGNGAGAGACRALLSETCCLEWADMVGQGQIHYIDLAQEDTFQTEFIHALNFPKSSLAKAMAEEKES